MQKYLYEGKEYYSSAIINGRIPFEFFADKDVIILKTEKTNINWVKEEYIENGMNFYSKRVIEEFLNEIDNAFKNNIEQIVEENVISFIKRKGLYKILYIPYAINIQHYDNLKNRTVVFVSDAIRGTGGINQIYSNVSKIFYDKGYDVRLWGTFDKGLKKESIPKERTFMFTDNVYHVVNANNFKKEVNNYVEPIFILSSATIYKILIPYVKDYVVINQYHSSIVTLLKNYANDEARYNNIEQFISDGYIGDMLLMLSETEKRMMKQFLKREVDCVYNFTPLPTVTTIENTYQEEKKDLLWCGRMGSKAKQFDEIIKIAEILKNRNMSQKIYVYSEIDKNIENTIKEKHLEDIIILKGYSNNKEEIYSGKKYLLLTSKYEGFSMVSIEAITYGVKPLIFDCALFIKEYFVNETRRKYLEIFDTSEEIIDYIKINQEKEELKKEDINPEVLKKYFKEIFDEEYIFNGWIKIIEKAILQRNRRNEMLPPRDQITLLKEQLKGNK